MGWLRGKSTGNHRFSHEIREFPIIFPLNQPIETSFFSLTSDLSLPAFRPSALRDQSRQGLGHGHRPHAGGGGGVDPPRGQLCSKQSDEEERLRREFSAGCCYARRFLMVLIWSWLVVTGTWLLFSHSVGNHHPNWLIFFRGLETTNQGGFLKKEGYSKSMNLNTIFHCKPSSYWGIPISGKPQMGVTLW